jgi:hypothetical protein
MQRGSNVGFVVIQKMMDPQFCHAMEPMEQGTQRWQHCWSTLSKGSSSQELMVAQQHEDLLCR